MKICDVWAILHFEVKVEGSLHINLPNAGRVAQHKKIDNTNLYIFRFNETVNSSLMVGVFTNLIRFFHFLCLSTDDMNMLMKWFGFPFEVAVQLRCLQTQVISVQQRSRDQSSGLLF